MLKSENLSKIYSDGTKGLTGLNIEVKEGEIYCLLGANGAGKTTTINLFLNFISPSRGTACIDGIDVVKDPLGAKKCVSYVPENVMLYGNLKAIHNLEFFSKLGERQRGDDPGKDDYYTILRRVGLEESVIEKKVKYFSKGMRQKLSLAIAIIKGAPNMLMDEPTAGLDPKAAHDFTKILLELKDENKAVLISTHDLFRAKRFADRIGIMNRGVLVAEMTPKDIGNENIEEIYLEYINRGEI